MAEDKFRSIINKSSSEMLYNSAQKKALIRLSKFVSPDDIRLPADHDEMVEDGLGNSVLKYHYQIAVKWGGVWAKCDRDALAECFPGVVAPIPRASNYRDK